MIFETKTVKLKDGREAILRAPKVEDAAEMIEYLRTACGQTEYLANYPEEVNYTVEGEEYFLQANLDSGNQLMIVCEVDGKIAGNCQIVFMTSLKTRHRAEVMIALLREYWGLGIGGYMLDEMIKCGRERGVERLELDMIEGNERAFGLYAKKGFVTAAEIPGAFRFRDGSYHADIRMEKEM